MSNELTPAEKALEHLAGAEQVDDAEVEGFAIYVKIDSVPGDAAAHSGHKDWIIIQSMSQPIARPSAQLNVGNVRLPKG